jgi:hypothetical protein
MKRAVGVADWQAFCRRGKGKCMSCGGLLGVADYRHAVGETRGNACHVEGCWEWQITGMLLERQGRGMP